MKIIKKYNTIAVGFLAFIVLTACERTELCYDHYPKVGISFAWEQEWERDYGMRHRENWDADRHGFDYDYMKPDSPEWINLIKYRDKESYGEHYFTPHGGDIVFTEHGDYSFLFYNGDTEYIVLSDIASLPDARASATPRSRSSISYLMERHPGVRSANPPDVLYSAFMNHVPSMGIHETTQLPVKMQPLVFTYVVRYEFEKGLEYVALARGALGGMAESVYLRDGRTSDDSIIILYDCEIKDYGCEAHVKSFGIPGFPDDYYGRSAEGEADRPYTLNLEVLLTNGKTMEFNFDVADQLKNQPKGGVIVVSGLKIEMDPGPPQDVPGGTFDVDLSGWGVEEIDLPVEEIELPE